MSENFKKLILPEIKNIITPIDYNLIPLTLKQSLSDSEARKDLGEDEVVTPHQWAQEFCFPLFSQKDGSEGILLTNGYGNTRYVRLVDGTILVVNVD